MFMYMSDMEHYGSQRTTFQILPSVDFGAQTHCEICWQVTFPVSHLTRNLAVCNDKYKLKGIRKLPTNLCYLLILKFCL